MTEVENPRPSVDPKIRKLAADAFNPPPAKETKNDAKRKAGLLWSPYRKVRDEFVPNPIAKLPPNLSCPCGSHRKFKRCCGPDTRAYILKQHLPNYQKTYEAALRGEKAW